MPTTSADTLGPELLHLEKELDDLITRYRSAAVGGDVPTWILPPLSCQFVCEAAALLPPKSSAFEFGSGRSTHALRSILGGVTSVEDSAEWLQRTEVLEGGVKKRQTDYSSVLPLRRCWNRLRVIESFPVDDNEEALERLKAARFILVDSPPNPAKREHALYLAMKHAPGGAIIVLDDLEVRATSRFAERLAAQNPSTFRFWMVPIDHQLGVFLKLRGHRVRSLPSLREFVGTWLRA